MNTYQLEHTGSVRGVGFFAPRLTSPLSRNALLEAVQATPNDAFLRLEACRALAAAGHDHVRHLASHPEPTLAALALETILLTPALQELTPLVQEADLARLGQATPLVFLRHQAIPEAQNHARWSLAWAEAVHSGNPLPQDLPPLPCAPAAIQTTDPWAVRARLPLPAPKARPPLPQVLARGVEALRPTGALYGPPQRHTASLAPWGLMASWRLHRTVTHGNLAYQLVGTMTSYGRGLTREAAQVSLIMEIAERFSSFATVERGHIPGLLVPQKLRTACPGELPHALDLTTLALEASPPAQPLTWMQASDPSGAPVWVPVQCVYLFTNLDEPQLFSALGSTGLASGSDIDEAKVAGLLEVLERDAEILSPWDLSRAFRPTSRDPEVSALLQAYAEAGIDLLLMDITTEFGVPCLKAAVPLPHGGMAKATAAGLCGRQAALAAITEVPFPFPGGPPSGRWEADLPTRDLEDLPDLSTGSPAGDRMLLEALLAAHRRTPLYAELTRADIGIPVVRAMVPGLESATDLDEFSCISPRLAAAAQKATLGIEAPRHG